ncbi:beta-N-acetylhexosaminidase [Saccharicrinis aurantiacus]|uniref:beta-N-acetylhexosaminidase n=1 Tax=Saccharicrinis aurantiacus TaxID=1849719 RepID=UPI00249383FD|nr:family 20 glycosylhydrolase [Saccharicrinis aurantiacus]
MKQYIAIALLICCTSLIKSQNIEAFLIPQPKTLEIKNGQLNQQLNTQLPTEELYQFLKSLCAFDYVGQITHFTSPYAQHSISFLLDDSINTNDAYTLDIDSASISIKAKNLAGLYYGKQTLQQLISYSETTQQNIPALHISDAPDFERRGYMLDISRNKVPTMESIFKLIDLLASLKINEFQLYTEHTFAYKNHKMVWEGCSPITPEEIQIIDLYCKSKHIDLVPNQNSFGHMENWLRHDEYLHLAECPEDCKTIWGMRKRTSLNPVDPKSLELMEELYAELLPNFSSKYLNIGCDETVELGCGETKEICKEKGKGTIYLEYLIKLNNAANKNGVESQFWGDIVLNHPELIKDIPTNMTAVIWGYEAEYPFETNLPKFKDAGLDFYVCPGTSTWRSLIGRNKNAFENQRRAAFYGKANGAKGYLNTTWGDYGHWQPLSVVYPSIMTGAAYSWNSDVDPKLNLENQLNTYVFKDKTGNTAKAVLKLGNAYLKAEIPSGNANAFHLMLRRYAWTMNGQYQTKHLKAKNLDKANKEIDDALTILNDASPSADSLTVIDELKHAADMAKHGIMLGKARLAAPKKSTENISRAELEELINDINIIIENHQKLWLLRNRDGGSQESLGNLNDLKEYYQEALNKK